MKTIHFLINIFFLGFLIIFLFTIMLPDSLADLSTTEQKSVIQVEVMPAKLGNLNDTLTISSTVEPKDFVQVFPPHDGVIVAVFKARGDTVKKGDLIIRLQRDELESDIDQQQLAIKILLQQKKRQEILLRQKENEKIILQLGITSVMQEIKAQKERILVREKEFARDQKLFAAKSLSEQEYTTSELKLRESHFSLEEKQIAQAKSEQNLQMHTFAVALAQSDISEIDNEIAKEKLKLKKMMIQFNKTDITAKIGGILTNFDIYESKKVFASEELFSIVSQENLQVYIDLPQRYLPFVKEGQDVNIYHEVMPPDLRDIPHGKISFLHPVLDKRQGTIPLTIDIQKNHSHYFRIGMFVTTEIIVQHRTKPLVLIPKKARLFKKDIPFIYVIKNQRAHRVFLEKEMIVAVNKYYYGVDSGIVPGDVIVVSEHSRLQPNAMVHVKKEHSFLPFERGFDEQE